MENSKQKLISIVIPCYNEEKNIDRTFDALIELSHDHKYNFEFIAVNDGSKDTTWEVITRYAKKHDRIIGVNMMTNYGLTQAYMAGFKHSKGDFVITMAADLEIPVGNLNKVIDYLDEGYDFVNTNRIGRWGKDRAVKSGIANKIISKVSHVTMKDRGSGMKGFRRIIIDNLKMYGEMHRFIPDYLTLFGAKMIEFDVEFRDRDFGKSAYSKQKRTIKVILDIMTLAFMLYFSKKPFYAMPGRLFGFTGAVIAGVGGIFLSYLFVLKLLGYSIGSRPLFIVAILMFVMGIQSVMMGMLGELMMRTYFEGSKKDTFLIREVI
ncbi:hypothetical protein A2V49_02800 [candidate division WWE3 bacterium RBG_19FT_COMBO_34_6]|uniref:Glycosyltransferase 2-like domain-containing protein n=1 Tax=candidate division WWE3 bacterium RBG_19FT_COMBO_34_6 TaxID=1802612 RepID=A0A1F4UN98_UNCKA|nr:MAG: hypothetical protein A2V49_02800 [candidate division WWE3 bacterium RBG_19FT_COMBO_34_6]